MRGNEPKLAPRHFREGRFPIPMRGNEHAWLPEGAIDVDWRVSDPHEG